MTAALAAKTKTCPLCDAPATEPIVLWLSCWPCQYCPTEVCRPCALAWCDPASLVKPSDLGVSD